MKAAGIPQDVQAFDIEYMSRYKDFTYDNGSWAGLPEFIKELHQDGIKIMLILNPAIAMDRNYPTFTNGLDQDVFIKWKFKNLVPEDQDPEAKDYMIGYLRTDYKTVYPDFFKPETRTWWSKECQILHETLSFDSLWIDMNEPSNFGTNLARSSNYPADIPDWSLKCPVTIYDNPDYPTKASYADNDLSGTISDKTICMSGAHSDGHNSFMHFDVHSLYGWSQSVATYRALNDVFPGRRQHVLSRSTFPGSGQYASHWLGDNISNWGQMRMSIVGMLEFNLFGIPHVGADICGFNGNATEELCARWMQLGAFYPLSRNHNTRRTVDQDPANPELGVVPAVSRNALLLRYKYLPYLYSLFHRANTHAWSVVRPLFNIFPTDVPARDVDDQFFWGSMLMIAPVLEEGARSRIVYFPEGLWYDLVGGTLASDGSQTITVDAPVDTIPLYVRGGSILPYQEPNVTTTLSRSNPFGLTVALDDAERASGEIFWDDGETIHKDVSKTYMSHLDFSNNRLTMSLIHGSTIVDDLKIETIEFYGYSSDPTNITVNGIPLYKSRWHFNNCSFVISVYPTLTLAKEFSLVLIN